MYYINYRVFALIGFQCITYVALILSLKFDAL